MRNQPNTRDATGIGERGGEALLDLVDPEHGGRERSRDLDRLAQRQLGAALAAERGGEVEAQQRELPLARHRARRQRLAAALHAEQQQAARRRQPERHRLVA